VRRFSRDELADPAAADLEKTFSAGANPILVLLVRRRVILKRRAREIVTQLEGFGGGPRSRRITSVGAISSRA